MKRWLVKADDQEILVSAPNRYEAIKATEREVGEDCTISRCRDVTIGKVLGVTLARGESISAGKVTMEVVVDIGVASQKVGYALRDLTDQYVAVTTGTLGTVETFTPLSEVHHIHYRGSRDLLLPEEAEEILTG